jgi:PAS domain-containing protein
MMGLAPCAGRPAAGEHGVCGSVRSIGLVGHWHAGEPQFIAFALLVLLYAFMVLVGGISYWRKATALILARNEAVRHEQMLAVVLQDFEQRATDALWEIDTEGRLQQPSARLAKLLHTAPDTLRGLSLVPWLEQHTLSGSGDRRQLAKGVPFHNVAVVIEQGGQHCHLALQGKPLFDELGQPSGWRGVISDRTAIEQAQQLLQRQAHTDSLTQLANRLSLHTAIEQQLRVKPIQAHCCCWTGPFQNHQ